MCHSAGNPLPRISGLRAPQLSKMDISSLLSPQDSPVRETPPPPPSTARGSPKRAGRNKPSSNPKVGQSPLSRTSLPASSSPRHAKLHAYPTMPSPPTSAPGPTVASAVRTPPIDSNHTERQHSTSGMDTLADLASMQHHQQEARANAGGLRSVEVFDTQNSPVRVLPSIHALSRPPSVSRASLDLGMPDVPTSTPPPRMFTAKSLSESDLETVAQLVSYLAENPFAYESHIQLVKLLHRGFVSHVTAGSASTAQGNPHTYDLLQDLRQATEAMDARFALGEELWADRLQAQQLLASSLEDCIGVVESHKKAVQEEAGSTRLWLMYGDWMLSLYGAAHPTAGNDALKEDLSIQQGWSDEDRMVAAEVFGRQQLLEIWKQGADETGYRMHDGHLIWDRYTDFLLLDLVREPTSNGVLALTRHFMDRLQIPHSTWDITFQRFSTFTSTYDNMNYEETMVTANRLGADAKNKYANRDALEIKLQRAVEMGDRDAEWTVYAEYLEWELSQSRKRKNFSFELINSLYQRATIRFPSDTNLWEDYLSFLVEEVNSHQRQGTSPMQALERATRHCPWSGTLWAQYLQAAEQEDLPFTSIGHIKHKATSTGLLDAGGMEEMLKVHTAWCGFLRRRAFQPDSTDEELDVAEVGIRSAIEDMETLGRQKYDKEYKGDPQYRLERIYIKYLSQCGNWQGARDTWKGLVARHRDSYEFWMRYYGWEMITWGKLTHDGTPTANQVPSEATKVMRQAIKGTHLDWPEKIMDTFLVHCEDHENVTELQSATIQVRKAVKTVAKRREKEALEAAEAARVQQAQSFETEALEPASNKAKRKREDNNEENDATTKKSRPDNVEPSEPTIEDRSNVKDSMLKRDRENTTVVVKNLPLQTTEARVRQYFRDCGTMNSLKIYPEDDGNSATATIEFESKEDVLTAQTRDMKTLDGNSIEVQIGTGTTIYVANFPPTADETYIKDLFSEYGEIVDVRFPSLKYNSHRRFCYVQFKSSRQAQAATRLDGKSLSDKLNLIAKISDPNNKQNRSGAIYDGREIYISNVDWSATEEEIRQIFSKYGKVERVRIPTNVAGKSKGIAFIVFSNKDEAKAATDMDLTKFKSRILHVVLSSANHAKRTATTVINPAPGFSESTSPQPESQPSNGGEPSGASASPSASSLAPPTSSHRPTREDISSRTIALLNIPDTVNDARIRALVEPYGPLVKIILKHDHQGAIVEFRSITDAGKATLGLDGVEIVPGRKIGVGSVEEMKHQKAEYRNDKLSKNEPSTTSKKEKNKVEDVKSAESTMRALQSTAIVRRPGQRRGGKREGLGYKRGGGLPNGGAEAKSDDTKVLVDGEAGGSVEAGKERGKKTQADFRAMLSKGK